MAKLVHTIVAADIGKRFIKSPQGNPLYVGGCLGYVQPGDVGKRVYVTLGVVQVENNEQRDKRLGEVAR